jgi:EAL domain-containing protein (putative c-di-GMP-specific phosphodiesterase class I)
MAHALRLTVVAEGVETAEQASHLRSIGCDHLQGYLFSRAIPAADFSKLLKQAKRT